MVAPPTAAGLRRLLVNPLIVKDGLARVRSWRAPAMIALYLGLLGVAAWLAFAAQLVGPRPPVGYAQVARNVFGALALVQLALVCLIAPSLAAGAISGERERQTLDVLLVTCVPSLSIVWGKLIASVAFVLLLVVAALPLFATVFLFGGVDGLQFLAVQVLTVTTALAVAAVSLFLSALFRRTPAATLVAYGLTFAATVPSWVGGNVLEAAGHIRTGQAVLSANPIQAMAVVLRGPSRPLPPGSRPQPFSPEAAYGFPLQGWQPTVALELTLVVLCVLGTVLFLRERRRLDRRPA
jgi:ABC-type Na+ efflux pump permease subunit